MDVDKVTKSVRRITVLRKDTTGGTVPVVVFERRSARRKGSRFLRPVERVTRDWADAQSRAANSYLARHNKSNRKRKDGWVRDYALNVLRASRKGSKAIKINRLFSVMSSS